jgi:hypothetical protein
MFYQDLAFSVVFFFFNSESFLLHLLYWNLIQNIYSWNVLCTVTNSVVEPHHFYSAPAPGKNFDAAPVTAPTLLYSKAKFLKLTKV